MFALHFTRSITGRMIIDDVDGDEFMVADGQLFNVYGESTPVDSSLTIAGPLAVDGHFFDSLAVDEGNTFIGYTSSNHHLSMKVRLPSVSRILAVKGVFARA